MQLDFGGCVKEYGADAAAAALQQAGISHGLVDLAGDMAAVGGQADGRPWQVGIRSPVEQGRAVAGVRLVTGGLASSGDYERCIEFGGRRYGHILDPRRGWPVEGLAAVSVTAPQCLVAGSSATMAMLMPQEEALAWLEGPDEESRTKDANGARIERDGSTWVLVNYGKHRDKDYSTPRVRRWRERKAETVGNAVSPLPTVPGTTDTDTDTDTDTTIPVESELEPFSHIESPKREKTTIPIRSDEESLVEARRVWVDVLGQTAETVPEHNFATWLRPTWPMGLGVTEEGKVALVVRVPGEQHRAHIWGSYGARLRSALERAAPGWELRLIVGEEP